jgi:hypothetical protein
MSEKRRREIPVRACPACHRQFFREVTLHQWLKPEAIGLVPSGPSGQLDQMAPTILLCLCGTPQPWRVGGVRGGRSPNHELCQFLDSIDVGSGEVKQRHDLAAVDRAAEETLIKRKDFEVASAIMAQQERAVGRLLSGKHPKRRPDNACWRPPNRRAAAERGRDWLAIELQKRGMEFREARAVVTAIFSSITDALKSGEKVDTSLGTFLVKERTKQYHRVRPLVRRESGRVGPAPSKAQTLHRIRKRVVFKPRFSKG